MNTIRTMLKNEFQTMNRVEKIYFALPLAIGWTLYGMMVWILREAAISALPAMLLMTILSILLSTYFRRKESPAEIAGNILTLMMIGICFSYAVEELFNVNSVFSLLTYGIALSMGCITYLLVPQILKVLDFKYTPWIMIGLSALIYGTLLVLGTDPNGQGTVAWIRIAGHSFQITEFVKLITLFFYASIFPSSKYSTAEKLAISTIMLGINVIGSLLIKELGSFTILLLLHLLLIVVQIPNSMLKTKYLELLLLGLFGSFVLFMMIYGYLNPYYEKGTLHGISTYLYLLARKVYERFSVFLRINTDPSGSGYQIGQSTSCLLTSSILGRNAAGFIGLPLAESDCAYSALASIFGLLPASLLILLYYRIFRVSEMVAKKNLIDNRKQAIAVYGAGALVYLQALVNILGTCNLLPYTGITLPLISFGGASYMITFMLLSFILRVSEQGMRGMEEVPVYTFGKKEKWYPVHHVTSAVLKRMDRF